MVVILLLIILFQSTQEATLRLFFWKVSTSQAILIFLTLLIGFVMGFVVATVLNKRSRKTDKSQVERLKDWHQESCSFYVSLFGEVVPLFRNGEFILRGFYSSLSGNTERTKQEIPFFLKKGENPDDIK